MDNMESVWRQGCKATVERKSSRIGLLSFRQRGKIWDKIKHTGQQNFTCNCKDLKTHRKRNTKRNVLWVQESSSSCSSAANATASN
jgi:hypothetical protein